MARAAEEPAGAVHEVQPAFSVRRRPAPASSTSSGWSNPSDSCNRRNRDQRDRRHRAHSHNAIAPAVATFSDSACSASGIVAHLRAGGEHVLRQALALRSQHERRRSGSSTSGSARPPCATSPIRGPGASSKSPSGTRKSAPAEARSAFGPVRIGAPGGQADSGTERVRGADQRADVAGIGDAARARASPAVTRKRR